MRYFVIGDDGSKYGPADVETLNAWIQEGRLMPTTLLEEEASGTRIAGAAVQGLVFPPSATAAPGPTAPGGAPGPGATSNPYSQPNYVRATQNQGTGGSGFVIGSWICCGIGFVVCCCFGWVLNAVGLGLGVMANKEGHRAAKAAITCNAISLVLGIVLQFVVGPMTGKSLMDYLGKNQAQMEKNMSPSDKAKFEQNMKQFQDSMNKAKAQSGQ